jgi:uncharacterized HAD superfamily protein
MRIGVDLDECLSEFVFSFLNFHNHKYGTDFDKKYIWTYEFEDLIGTTSDEVLNRVNEFYGTNFFREVPVVWGSRDAVRELSSENELFIITARPNYISKDTERYLDHHFHDVFSDITYTNQYGGSGVVRTKSEVCEYLGVSFMVEDNLSYARACSGAGFPVYLLDRPWNQNGGLIEGVTRVSEWADILGKNGGENGRK